MFWEEKGLATANLILASRSRSNDDKKGLMNMTTEQEETKRRMEAVIRLRKEVDDLFMSDGPNGEMAQVAFEQEQSEAVEQLSDAERALRASQNQKDFWITKSGTVLLVSEMTDGHLVNAIRWMHRQYDVYLVGLSHDDIPLLFWQLFPKLPTLQDECDKRGLNWRNSK